MSLRSIELGPSPFMKRWKVDPVSRLPISPFSDPAWSHRNGCERPPRPFLRTHLGKLPPEIREEIWGYVISSLGECAIEANAQEPQALTDAMSSVALSEAPPPSTQNEVSCPALLQVCRVVYQEAKHIYYATTMFQFTDPSSLITFLKGIGIEQRSAITVLRLGGLTSKRHHYTEERLDEYCRNGIIRADNRDIFASMTMTCEHPKAKEAISYLKECEHLKTIYVDMKVGQELQHILFLCHLYGHGKTVVDFPDTFHWTVRWAPQEWEEWRHNHSERARPQGSEWGDDIRGNDRFIEVDVGLVNTVGSRKDD